MLIVSKFHDYYDVGMKLGVDKTVVYDRKTLAIKDNFLSLVRHSESGWTGAVLAFCGKFYPFIYHTQRGVGIDRIIWTLPEALAILPRSKWSFSWDDDRLDTDNGIKKFFERKYPELEKVFHDHKCPVFGFTPPPTRVYSWRNEGPYRALTLNPSLKDLEFYKVKDPITAFQDIYMFISGVIGTTPKPTKPIDDKIMAASKGHDGKYSFKKPPGKRGKNRWR